VTGMPQSQELKTETKQEANLSELVLFIAKKLVLHPEDVTVTQNQGADALILEMHVHPEDMGKVIGKQGRIAKAIRSVVKAASSRHGKPVYVEIV